jgi:hypothetical protein
MEQDTETRREGENVFYPGTARTESGMRRLRLSDLEDGESLESDSEDVHGVPVDVPTLSAE